MPPLPFHMVGPALSDVVINSRIVKGKLCSLNPNSAPGPDEIHLRVLREGSQALSVPLALLYRKSLDTGMVPQDWKLGRIVPTFKKGDRQDPTNYCPVSIMGPIAKYLVHASTRCSCSRRLKRAGE